MPDIKRLATIPDEHHPGLYTVRIDGHVVGFLAPNRQQTKWQAQNARRQALGPPQSSFHIALAVFREML